MDATLGSIVISIALVTIVIWASRVVNWVWLNPKRLEKLLREQGLNGNPYKFFLGDMKELGMMTKDAKSTPVGFSDDISSHALPYHHHIINKFGKNSFIWYGPIPRLNIVDPEVIKEIFSRPNELFRPYPDPLLDMVNGGLMCATDDKWVQLYKTINPAFHLQNLKNMLPSIYLSCKIMVNKWETLSSTNGTCEVDVWPYLQDLSGDLVSRTMFGSSYEEGRQIFQLQQEQVDVAIQLMPILFIPGWRFLPTKANKRMREICTELDRLLMDIIKKREREIEMGEVKDDLLGILLESNSKENQEHGSIMSSKEVLEECKLFYFTGTKTPSSLFLWTMVLLSKHQSWQVRAREEVLKIFGKKPPHFDGLNHLKIVTMILLEVLRLYSPGTLTNRAVKKNTKLGNMNLPAGVELCLPIILLHYDRENWGNDAKEFKPERFSEGVSKATKSQYSFIPFGGGLRICIGQNLAMIEAKMVITTILQHFTFELSPNYVHAPFPKFTLQPQHGAQIILHKL